MKGSAGDFALESTIDIKFNTITLATGAPITLAGTPAISAYVDNGTTEITAGITLTVDFDGRTGLHNVRVVATAANGYAAGTSVSLVLTAGTVGGTTVVGIEVGSFTLARCAALRPTVAGSTLDVSAGGECGVDWANVGSPTTSVVLSGTTVGVLTTYTGNTVQTGDAFERLGAPDGASVSVDVAAVKMDTAAILVDTGTTLDGRIPAALVSGRMDSSVGAMASGVVTNTAIAADAIGASELAADAVTEIAAGVWAVVIETGFTAEDLVSLMSAVLLGKIADAGTTTNTFRDVNDTANRVVATVTAAGVRSAVTKTPA